MKMHWIRAMFIGPFLLLMPMMCMHLPEGNHSGSHHSTAFEEPARSERYLPTDLDRELETPSGRDA